MNHLRSAVAALSAASWSGMVWAGLPAPRGDIAPEVDAVRVVVAFIACMIVLAALVLLLRRFGPLHRHQRREGRHVAILDSVSINSATQLLVVEFAGRKLLVARSANQLSLLSVAPATPTSGEADIGA